MNSRTSTILTVLGFFLFLFGMLALIYSMTDLRVTFLNWITEMLGRGPAMVVHLCMIIFGLVMVVAARGNFSGEDPVPIERGGE